MDGKPLCGAALFMERATSAAAVLSLSVSRPATMTTPAAASTAACTSGSLSEAKAG